MDRSVKNFLSILLLEDGIGRKYLLNVLNAKYKYFSGSSEYLDDLEDMGITVLAYDEPEYPSSLRKIPDFPVLLFVKGDLSLLKMNMVTIVGTRRMTGYGKKVTEDIVTSLKNVCFVSGLARGIDGEVHKNCLKNNIATIAVTAGGFGDGFPVANGKLFEKICEEGLVISEFPPGRQIVKGMFPMRNRILAGLSTSTIVVESGMNGGSMITAHLAMEYGREVFSVPGDIFSTSSQGCNFLIDEGANIAFNMGSLEIVLNDCVHNPYK